MGIAIPHDQSLDNLALDCQTDKSSAFHNYTKIYEHYFDRIRNSQFKFLEIGIFHGNSVKLWESYFPHAELHFMDVDEGNIKYHSERSKYHFLNQGNIEDINKFIENAGSNFDVIIDDGGHQMAQQILSFIHLFPHLNSKGIYIIEDLHTSYWKEYGGRGDQEQPRTTPKSTTEFLKRLIDDINYVGARTGCADYSKISSDIFLELNYMQKHLFSMHFYDSVCVIIKK